MQSPTISSPLKQTNEIDWITPLKQYIRQNYGDDPERYSEECATLNRLRQDMRGAGKDNAAGRDLLYRYYGQLEFLDLRFPIDENHIKISFTWFDAFTHKPISQHSLAYEKASVIFNIAAVLSCHAARQNRSEETGLKVAYHHFQASAGMFTYINENFLHAPSIDLNHDTVRTLIAITLAQAQEIFLEKSISNENPDALVAKIASQAATLYSQAIEGVQENVTKAVFEKVWLLLTQFKAAHVSSVAQYYQALADSESGSHGTAIARLQAAEKHSKEAGRIANNFPNSLPANSNLGSDTGTSLVDMHKRHTASVQEKLVEFNKDNDFIYHQLVPNEASLPAIPKRQAAKTTSVSQLYKEEDINKIIGPDIFQRIVPMSVTESASLYDEEKAKLIRAETERAEIANSEMAASLDYLKLPDSLNVIKGGMDKEMSVDEEFRTWCQELAGHAPFAQAFEDLGSSKDKIVQHLEQCSRQLDMEESVCEKMRSKYGAEWTQQPSSRLTATLRNDIKNYNDAIAEASISDTQLQNTLRQFESDFDEMRSAGEADEADVLYHRAMVKAGAARSWGKNGPGSPASGGAEGNLLDEDFDDGSASVADQISSVEELMRKLNLIKRERAQVLKDLKEKIHNDDISQVLILNKKSITSQEQQLFKSELEKFRPHQTRLLQANHKQSSVMKELTRKYGDLLQDKRVRAEQNKYESFTRQRNSVLSKYRKIFQAFNDLMAGLERAQGFYSEMRNTVESLSQNVDSFVNNRKSEGGELLAQIEKAKSNGNSEHADKEHERLTDLMNRMNMEASSSSKSPFKPQDQRRPAPLQNIPSYQPTYNPAASAPVSAGYLNARSPPPMQSPGYLNSQQQRQWSQVSSPPGNNYIQQSQEGSYGSYNPKNYGPVSPPPNQQHFTAPQKPQPGYSSPPSHQPHPSQTHFLPQGYVPPPPPPGRPPPQDSNRNSSFDNYGQNPQGQSGDPWSGLSGWR